MKRMFRAVTLLLLVGGWALAGSAVHVVRTPGNVAVVTKNQLGFHDTYLDTRKWTLADDQAHPAVVARLLYLKRPDLLRHTLPADAIDPTATLAVIALQQPTSATGVVTTPTDAAGSMMRDAAGQVKTVVDLAKAKAGKI